MIIGAGSGTYKGFAEAKANNKNAWTGKPNIKFSLDDIDTNGITKTYKVKYGDDEFLMGGDMKVENGILKVSQFDIDGKSTNQLGIGGVKTLSNEFGKYMGVDEIHFYGAKRTTGANPGKLSIYIHKVVK